MSGTNTSDTPDVRPVASRPADSNTASGPVPVLSLEYAPPPADARRTRAWQVISRVCLALGVPVCVIALLVIPFKVESVIITGPVLFTLGLLAVLGGLFVHDRLAVVVGACHCGVCVLFFVLVNTNNWGPADARKPFLVMGIIYTSVIATPTIRALMRRTPGETP